MDNHERRFIDEDIITNFSEDLIDPILERLTVKDAVRTSVLCKKWRYRWTSMRTLAFNSRFSERFLNIGAYQHNGFIRVINQIMIQHKGPISRFLLHIPKQLNLDSFQEVDQWMLILSRNNVRELKIINFNGIYQVPSSIFSCLELRKLKLLNCIFKIPFECQGFLYLEDISLTKISFGDNLSATVINLPQLTRLYLNSCVNVNNFNIKAEKLRILGVIKCPDAILFRLLHSEHLYKVYTCLWQSIEDFLQVNRFNLTMMLSKLPNIVIYTIDGYFLKFLAAATFPKRLPRVVKHLRKLEFVGFSLGDLDQLQGALCLLRNSPKLNAVCVTLVHMGPDADLELTSSYLESPDCLDQTLFKLETVEMTSVEGTRPELLFIKLLLDHSPRLEKMIVRTSATVDAEKRLSIANDVMLFPRASTKAKIVYLDPES